MNRVMYYLMLIALFLSISAVSATQLVITQPSANETILAEVRDFHVYGIFTGTVVNPGDIRIEVYPGETVSGLPVRVIQSHVDPVSGITNESVINATYCTVTGYCTRKNGAMVPDLVESPGGILDPTNKLVVTNRYYLGMILGGVTKSFDTNYTDSTGTPLTDLTAGKYTIRVIGLSGSFAGQEINKTITLGLTNAVLGTFRPTTNKEAITQYGITHNRRTYFDWFPGYFTDPDNSSVWWESPRRWTPNNGIEVVNDRPGTLIDNTVVANNTMFIYNINSGSATYSVELSEILKYGLYDSPNTTFLYYDTGEPRMTFNDASTGIQTLNGNPTPFPSGRRLVLYRVEIFTPSGTSFENLYDPNDATTPKTLNLNVGGGITVPQGKEFVVYGATKPIASTVTATSTPYRFTIDNRITQINCTITNATGNLVTTAMHDVNLSRLYTSGSPTRFNSFWEFGIEFLGLTTPGSYTISLEGVDGSGIPVAQTGTTFTATVVQQTTNSTVGVFRSGVFYLRDSNSAGNADNTFSYGADGDIPVVGDWTGQGKDTAGVFRRGVFYLKDSNSAGNADNAFAFGAAGDLPIVGDWTGQGKDTAGVFRQGVFYLKDNNSAGNADNTFSYGADRDIPIAGDWTGQGKDTVGVFRRGVFYLKDSNSAGNADNTFAYGAAGDLPVVWHHDGKDTIGVFRRGTFYLKDSNSAGIATNTFTYGTGTGDIPVDGKWI
jgi:hypothetical protein